MAQALSFAGVIHLSFHRCRHFVRFEGSMTLIGINVTALMMFVRIYAIYEGRKPVVLGLAVLLLAEFSVNAALLTYGIGTSRRAIAIQGFELCIFLQLSNTLSASTVRGSRCR